MGIQCMVYGCVSALQNSHVNIFGVWCGVLVYGVCCLRVDVYGFVYGVYCLVIGVVSLACMGVRSV